MMNNLFLGYQFVFAALSLNNDIIKFMSFLPFCYPTQIKTDDKCRNASQKKKAHIFEITAY